MPSCRSCLGTSLPAQPRGGAGLGATEAPSPPCSGRRGWAAAERHWAGWARSGLIFPLSCCGRSLGLGWGEAARSLRAGGCRAARPTCGVKVRMRWWLSPAAEMGVATALPCPSPGNVPRGVPAEPPRLGISLLSCREGYSHGQAAAPTACSIPSQYSATPGGSICLKHRSETGLSPHPRPSGMDSGPSSPSCTLPGSPARSSAPSPLLCGDPPTPEALPLTQTLLPLTTPRVSCPEGPSPPPFPSPSRNTLSSVGLFPQSRKTLPAPAQTSWFIKNHEAQPDARRHRALSPAGRCCGQTDPWDPQDPVPVAGPRPLTPREGAIPPGRGAKGLAAECGNVLRVSEPTSGSGAVGGAEYRVKGPDEANSPGGSGSRRL